MVMVQLIVSEVVPDVPEEVEIQVKRQTFIRSKLLDKVEDDDPEEVELEKATTTNNDPAATEQRGFFSFLPCCRSHSGKYMDRNKNMGGCSDVIVKQYPVHSASLHKSPMQQQI
jgi:hypothetical protein